MFLEVLTAFLQSDPVRRPPIFLEHLFNDLTNFECMQPIILGFMKCLRISFFEIYTEEYSAVFQKIYFIGHTLMVEFLTQDF